jgi:hypothetical protein
VVWIVRWLFIKRCTLPTLLFSKPRVLTLNATQQLVVIMGGQPRTSGYRDAHLECAQHFKQATETVNFENSRVGTRRNLNGASVHNGLSLPGGHSGPHYVSAGSQTQLVKELQSLNCFRIVASYGDCM